MWQLIFKRHTKHLKMTSGIVYPALNNKGIILGNGVVSSVINSSLTNDGKGHLCCCYGTLTPVFSEWTEEVVWRVVPGSGSHFDLGSFGVCVCWW